MNDLMTPDCVTAESPSAKRELGVGPPTYYVRHPDDSYSVADPQPILKEVPDGGQTV